MGDGTNAESVNHWKLERGHKPDVASVKEDYENLEKNILMPFKKACPLAKTFYHIGNHEDWFYQTELKHTWLKGFLGVAENIDLKKYRMQIVPLNGVIHFGHLYFTHGNYASGESHAKKMVMAYRKNIRYGHIHDKQEHFIQSQLDENEKTSAASIGCLCKIEAMDYLKKKPAKWVNAFNIAYIREDGTFNDYTVVLTDGRFTTPDGKTYD